MAEPLKNQFGPDVPQRLADVIAPHFPGFARKPFLQDALAGYAALELKPRGWQIAHALHRHLPPHYPEAVEILLASLGPKLEMSEGNGMAPFFYMPHTFFVAEYGLAHFAESMRANYELTQRFTAEFSIRPYLERYQDATLEQLRQWTQDPSEHVRRLVSEGTRPRLPWAPRLRRFQHDPQPVLALLELIKDDPSLYVRRSVANNLNDIGKDHPELLVETARRWLLGASAERQWLIRHGLRSLIKSGHTGALSALDFGEIGDVSLSNVAIVPAQPPIGDSVSVTFDLLNESGEPQRLLVDLRVHFVKASGKTAPKVFKLKSVALAPQERARFSKRIALAQLTTRKHYAGEHKVEVIINGATQSLGAFTVTT